MAAMSGAWLRRKVHQPWDGGPHRLTMVIVLQRRVSGRVRLPTHQGLRPDDRDDGAIITTPILSGLHHRYVRI
jgi:hypothetical protein